MLNKLLTVLLVVLVTLSTALTSLVSWAAVKEITVQKEEYAGCRKVVDSELQTHRRIIRRLNNLEVEKE